MLQPFVVPLTALPRVSTLDLGFDFTKVHVHPGNEAVVIISSSRVSFSLTVVSHVFVMTAACIKTNSYFIFFCRLLVRFVYLLVSGMLRTWPF